MQMITSIIVLLTLLSCQCASASLVRLSSVGEKEENIWPLRKGPPEVSAVSTSLRIAMVGVTVATVSNVLETSSAVTGHFPTIDSTKKSDEDARQDQQEETAEDETATTPRQRPFPGHDHDDKAVAVIPPLGGSVRWRERLGVFAPHTGEEGKQGCAGSNCRAEVIIILGISLYLRRRRYKYCFVTAPIYHCLTCSNRRKM
jgi:hypothetical protein